MLRIPGEKSVFRRVKACGKMSKVGVIRAHPAVNIRHQRSITRSRHQHSITRPKPRPKFESVIPPDGKNPLKF